MRRLWLLGLGTLGLGILALALLPDRNGSAPSRMPAGGPSVPKASCVAQAIREKTEDQVSVLSPAELQRIVQSAEAGLLQPGEPLSPELRIFAYFEVKSEGRPLIGLPPSLQEVLRARIELRRIPEPERTRWRRAASRELSELLSRPDNELSVWILPVVLAAAKVAALPKSRETQIVRTLASLLARRLEDRFPGAYAPKLYQFGKRVIRRQLGIETQTLTDFVVTRDDGRPAFHLFSTDPIRAGERESSYDPDSGLHILELEGVKARDVSKLGSTQKALIRSQVEWTTGGRSYRAEYEVIPGPTAERAAPAIRTLDYESQWQDGKYTGLVMPGQNMERFGTTVLNEYRSYYEAAGFHFGKPKPVVDFKRFLQGEVESGRLDYWLKEAHAEGDDRVLTKVVNEGSIVTGVRKLPKGREEVIHLYYARALSAEKAVPLEYTEISGWLNQRQERASGSQLAYIDTSCFGLTSACHLMSEAATPKLVVIGTTQQAETFTHEEGTALIPILDGLRSRATFPEIRRELRAQSESYREGNENLYRFPDETEWKDVVRGEMRRILKVHTKVTDSEGKPYSIEDVEQ